MELKLIWEIIRRRKYIIFFTFLIIISTTVIGTSLLRPVYLSTAKILVKKSESETYLLSNIGLDDNRTSSSASQSSNIENQIALATSKPVIEQLIQYLQLTDRKGDLQSPKKTLKSKFIVSAIFPEPFLEINAIDDTDMIEITAQSPNPEEADMMVNTLAEICIEENIRKKQEEFKNAEQHIKTQIEVLKSEYLKILNDILDYKIKQKTVNIDSEIKEAVSYLSKLMDKKMMTIIEIAEIQAKIDTLAEQLAQQNSKSVSSDTIANNSYIKKLKSDFIDLDLQRIAISSEKKPSHPDAVIVGQKLSKLEEELQNEISTNQQFSSEFQQLQRDLSGKIEYKKGLESEIRKYLIDFYTLPEKQFGENQLELDFKITEGIYSKLLEYLYQIKVVGGVVGSDIKIVENVTTPSINKKPDNPSLAVNLIIATFLASLFGFGLAFVVDYFDDTIKSPDQIKNMGATVFGTIPHLGRKDYTLISNLPPKDPYNEAYRTARNSINFTSTSDKPLHSLLISSCLPEQGKTTTAANLAISMSQEGKRILLLDLDLRQPNVHKLFNKSNSIGVTQVLMQHDEIENCIIDSGVTGLSLLTSGPIPPDPAFIIGSEKMKDLLPILTDRFDMVIIDTPPVIFANDAVILAGYVDKCISVVAIGKETVKDLEYVTEMLNKANNNFLGVIVNKVKTRKISYYYNA